MDRNDGKLPIELPFTEALMVYSKRLSIFLALVFSNLLLLGLFLYISKLPKSLASSYLSLGTFGTFIVIYISIGVYLYLKYRIETQYAFREEIQYAIRVDMRKTLIGKIYLLIPMIIWLLFFIFTVIMLSYFLRKF